MDKATKKIVTAASIVIVIAIMAWTVSDIMREMYKQKIAEEQQRTALLALEKTFGEMNKELDKSLSTMSKAKPVAVNLAGNRKQSREPNIQTTTISNGKLTTTTKKQENCVYGDNKKVCLKSN